MQFSYLHFKHPNILPTLDELSRLIFSEVYHPQDVRDEKVISALAHWEHGEIKILVPSKIRWIHGTSMESTESQRNHNVIATECHRDKTLTKNLSGIRRFIATPW